MGDEERKTEISDTGIDAKTLLEHLTEINKKFDLKDMPVFYLNTSPMQMLGLNSIRIIEAQNGKYVMILSQSDVEEHSEQVVDTEDILDNENYN